MIVFLPFPRDPKKASGSRSEKRYSQRELCCGIATGECSGQQAVECLGHGREGKAKTVSSGGKGSLERARRVTTLQEVQQTIELWTHTPLTGYETVRKLCQISPFHLCHLKNENNYSSTPPYCVVGWLRGLGRDCC